GGLHADVRRHRRPAGAGCRYLLSKTLDSFFEKLFNKTRAEHSKNFQRYEALFLILLIIIPLPGSGPGTATLIAFVFGIEYWKAIGLISLGAMGSGILIGGGISSILGIINLF
ncbi:MAG: small multi-drug export protein, partial [Candidatus Gracilibacteria bacterium]|nr:small multi-drug export protein [Candidatus Gracilibacteria bacterium]